MEAKEGDYVVTIRMTNDAVTTTVTKSALRWAAMRAILMFQELQVVESQDNAHKSQAVSEEKGEPKQNRIEVLLLISLITPLLLGQTGSPLLFDINAHVSGPL